MKHAGILTGQFDRAGPAHTSQEKQGPGYFHHRKTSQLDAAEDPSVWYWSQDEIVFDPVVVIHTAPRSTVRMRTRKREIQ